MEPICRLAQRALIAGEVSAELEAHIDECERCGRARRLSEFLVARSRGIAKSTIDEVFVRGQELLGYRLDEVVGSGGQGVVFRATELDVPGSVVALKIVHRDETDQAVREVSYAKRINHPNVCRVNTTKAHGKFRLIEMEFIDGGTLASRLVARLGLGEEAGEDSPKALSSEEATAVFRGVLDGLAAVHKKEILHLDLKPRNILLRDSTSPVVTDFGMSAQAGGEGLGGTTGWTAPEIDRGDLPDVRADVYSAGALLAALSPDPSDAMATVIARAKAQRREDRYESVAALRAAFEAAIPPVATARLDAAASGHRTEAAASHARRTRTVVAITLGLLAAGAIAGALALLPRGAQKSSDVSPVHEAAGAAGSTLPAVSLPPGYEMVDILDFRPADAASAPSDRVDALPYLNAHGIRVNAVTPPEAQMLLAPNPSFYDGTAVSGGPGVRSLLQDNTGNVPASYTLTLSQPVDRVDIALPGLIAATASGITHPSWTAHALDAAGNELSSYSEALRRHFENVPPRTYTLETPTPDFARIAALRFESDPRLEGKPFAAFSAVVIGRIVLSRRR